MRDRMYTKRYHIKYKWNPLPDRTGTEAEYFETDHFIVFLLKFLLLKRKHRIMEMYFLNL